MINPVILATQIQLLDGTRFAELANAILSETVARHGIDRACLSTNLRITEPDGGIDARCLNSPRTVGRIIPRPMSYYQFKGGDQQRSASAIARNDILAHPQVAQALREGYAFVYFAGWDRGEGVEGLIVNELREQDLVVEHDQIVFLGRDTIARILLTFPGLTARFLGLDLNIVDLDTWSRYSPFRNPYQVDASLSERLEDLRTQMVIPNAVVRVVGAAGDGKTRMVLEALRTAPLSSSVLYASQRSDVTPALIRHLQQTEDIQCTLVIDEVDDQAAEELIQRFSVMPPSVRLILIGLDASGLAQPRTFQVQGLNEELLIRTITAIVPGITPELARAIARDCERSPKIAVLVAERIRDDPLLLEPRRILADGAVRNMLNRYLELDPNSLAWQALSVTALVMRLGWTEQMEDESEILFGALGLDAIEARRNVVWLHERFGIAPLAGRFRYVSPAMLADHYAAQQLSGWTRNRLMQVLAAMTPAMRESFAQRVRRMADVLNNRSIVEAVILGDHGPFRGLDDLRQTQLTVLLRHLAGAFPMTTLVTLRRLIQNATIDELRAAREVRRDLVWALEQLLWPEQTFIGAAELLLRLAIAENETWANNATGLWVETFQMVLGRTAAGAVARRQVLRGAANNANPFARVLAAHAIGAATRMGDLSRLGMPPEDVPGMPREEWRPATWQEWSETIIQYLDILNPLIEDPDLDVRIAATQALGASIDAAMQLFPVVFDTWLRLARRLHKAPFEQRSVVIEAINRAMIVWSQDTHTDQEVTKSDDDSAGSGTATDASDPELARRLDSLATVAHELHGEDFSSRFRWAVDQSIWDRRQAKSEEEVEAAIEKDLEPLVQEVLDRPDLLEDEWSWLLQLKEWRAAERWIEVLARHDRERSLAARLQQLASEGERAIMWRSLYELAYARAYANDRHLDTLLATWLRQGEPGPQIADLIFRAGYSPERSVMLRQLIRDGVLTQLYPFAYSSWGRAIPIEEALTLVEISASIMDPGVIIPFVHMYLLQVPTAKAAFRDLSLRLLLADQLFEPNSGARDEWGKLAQIYIEDAPNAIMASALRRLVNSESIRDDDIRQVVQRAWEVGDTASLFAEVVGPALETSGVPGWQIRRVLSTLPINENVAHIILAWVTEKPEKRAAAAAELIGPPNERPSILHVALLEQFDQYGVGDAFMRALLTGTWSGSGVAWVKGKMERLGPWLSDERPAVQAWARELQHVLEGELQRFQRWDEEERFL